MDLKNRGNYIMHTFYLYYTLIYSSDLTKRQNALHTNLDLFPLCDSHSFHIQFVLCSKPIINLQLPSVGMLLLLARESLRIPTTTIIDIIVVRPSCTWEIMIIIIIIIFLILAPEKFHRNIYEKSIIRGIIEIRSLNSTVCPTSTFCSGIKLLKIEWAKIVFLTLVRLYKLLWNLLKFDSFWWR